MTTSSVRRLVRHQVTFMLTKTAALFLLIIVEAPGNIPGILILFEGGNPVRVIGIFPCQAGFEQSNPLLVRPIPHNFALKRTQSTDGRFDLLSRFCLVINQFGFNEFSGAVLDTVHAAHPFHLVTCFERFSDALGCCHLTYQLREQFFRLMIYIGKVSVQLAACQQTSIGNFAMLFDTGGDAVPIRQCAPRLPPATSDRADNSHPAIRTKVHSFHHRCTCPSCNPPM